MPFINSSRKPIECGEIAVLVFSRKAKKELIVKSLPAHQGGLKWVNSLHKRAAQVANSSGAKSYLLSETDQVGHSLPQRLCNAFEAYFALGFKAVVALASDVPELSTVQIADAITALCAGNAVLGPTFDGGDYLIGIHEAQYNREEMLSALSEKEYVHANLLSKLKSQNHFCEVLPTLRDIDSLQSLREWLKDQAIRRSSLAEIGFLLLSRVANSSWVPFTVFFAPQHQFLSRVSRRGPPVWI